MSLFPTYQQAVQDEDEDVCRGLCELFSEMGESLIDIILSDQVKSFLFSL